MMENKHSEIKDPRDLKIYNLQRRVHALTVDTVTNLLKKEGFNDRIREKDEDTMDIIKKPFAAAIIGFDKFKRVNTLYGHGKGDIYLNIISGEVERIVWDKGGIVFRWKEGDELALILPINSDDKQVNQEYRQTITDVSSEINNSLKIIGQDFIKEEMPEASNPRLSIGSILFDKGIDITNEPNEILGIVYGLMDKADESMMHIKQLENNEGENVKHNFYEDLPIDNEQK